MLVELASFSEDNFDPKAWVNASSSGKPPDEPLDRYLSEVEMKLQLLAEDIGSALEENGSHALLRVPRALREIHRVKDDALALRGNVRGILERLEKVETSSSNCVQTLASLDAVKRRMEGVRAILQEAAGLAQLMQGVDAVFASGDLGQVSETLSAMRRCLRVLSDAPEFAHGGARLQELESRLEAMVEPRLDAALAAHDAETTRQLRDILVAIGRSTSVERHYLVSRMTPLLQRWDAFQGLEKGGWKVIPSRKGGRKGHALADEDDEEGHAVAAHVAHEAGTDGSTPESFGDWLTDYLDEVLLVVEKEMRWCAGICNDPKSAVLLVTNLITSLFDSLSASFSARIDWAFDAAEEIAKEHTGSMAAGAAAGARIKSELSENDLATMGHGSPGGGDAEGEGLGEEGPLATISRKSPLGDLIHLHNVMGAFDRSVQRVLMAGPCEFAQLWQVVRVLYVPFEHYKAGYGDLERKQLLRELASLELGGVSLDAALAAGVLPPHKGVPGVAVAPLAQVDAAIEAASKHEGPPPAGGLVGGGEDLGDVVSRISASIPSVLSTLEGAIARCIAFTGGVEAEALLRSLDDVMLRYIGGLFELLRAVRSSCQLHPSKFPGSTGGPTGRKSTSEEHSTGSRQGAEGGAGAGDARPRGDGAGGKRGADKGGEGDKGGYKQAVLHRDPGGSAAGEDSEDGEGEREGENDWSLVQGVVQLLGVASSLCSRVAVFEMTLRGTLGDLYLKLASSDVVASALGGAGGTGGASRALAGANASADGEEPSRQSGDGYPLSQGSGGRGGANSGSGGADKEPVHAWEVRLAENHGKCRRLLALLEQARDMRLNALPHTSQRVQTFVEMVHELVYDVLMAKVRWRFANVAAMPVWREAVEQNEFELPSFNVYPLPYITSVGEYLLMLPQQLEQLTIHLEGSGGMQAGGGGGEGEESYLASEWMFRVAEGAVSLYATELLSIKVLSDPGAAQLGADIEYICNVLTALSVAVPPSLATFQVLVSVPAIEMPGIIRAAEGSLDIRTVQAVCKMRKVELAE
eukprot:jgi/Mesvir1/12483/Mv10242-RA.1